MIHRAPRISARQKNQLIKCFALDVTASRAGYHYHTKNGKRIKIAGLVDVSRHCADRWYRHFREVIYLSLRRAPRFGGEIEMDQSFFGGGNRKKIRAALKRIQHLPHREYMDKSKVIRDLHRTIVFGILQRRGRVYVQVVRKMDKRTLMPIVRLVVEQGSTVYTDKWRGFTELGLDGYTHHSINHAIEYKDQQGNHLNGIETFWSFAKRRLAKFNGISPSTLLLHLQECVWRFNEPDVALALKKLLAVPF